MINLRPYQLQAIDELREGFREHKRQILALTTGAGKTVVFSSIVANAALKNKTVLTITNRVELFKQTFKAIDKHNISVCKIDAQNKRIDANAKVFIAMIETLKRRAQLLKDLKVDLIIIDECHINSFNKVFELWPEAKVIGCSATPISKTLHLYYTNIVQPIDTLELIDNGYLVPCKAYQMQDDFSDLKTDSSGEFTNTSLDQHFRKSKLYEGVIDAYLEKSVGRKTVVFNCNIEHTIEMTRAFNLVGVKSYAITSETSDEERNRILKDFEDGKFPVLNNCGILTTGWDCPSVKTVILNRATCSLPLFLQMCGRGSRTYDGKDNFLCLDFGENHNRFGLWQQNRTWSLEPPKKKKKGLGIVPVRSCKNCGAMLPATQRKCNYCGYEITDKEKELLQGELVEVTEKIIPTINPAVIGKKISELTVAELIDLEATKKIKNTYAWRVLRAKGEAAIIEYANAKKFKNGWISRQISDMANEEMDKGKVSFKDFMIQG